MKILSAILLLCCAIAVNAQPDKVFNDPNAVARAIPSAFSSISVSSGVELFLTQGNETALAVSVSDQKYAEGFKAEVVNGVMKIYYDYKGMKWANDKNRKLKAYLSCKSLESIKASAGANVVLTNELNAADLKMSFSSGSMLKGKLQVKNLMTDVSSGAMVTVSGTAAKLTVTASSGAVFKGFDLTTAFCTASANSGAAIKIEVQKELKASANSGADISYKGNATLIKGNINSGGSVKHAN